MTYPHMLRYWIEDKGIEAAVEHYYPNLLKTNPEFSAAYLTYRNAKTTLLAQVDRITNEAREAIDNEQDDDHS